MKKTDKYAMRLILLYIANLLFLHVLPIFIIYRSLL